MRELRRTTGARPDRPLRPDLRSSTTSTATSQSPVCSSPSSALPPAASSAVLPPGFAPARDAIGERGEDRQPQRLRLGGGVDPRAARRPSAEASWRRTRPDLLDRAGVQLQPAEQRRGESAPPRPRGRDRPRSTTSAPRSGRAPAPAPNDARALARMSRSPMSAAASAAASPAPRASPSTTSRASRGWIGKRSMRRPTSVRAPARGDRAQPAGAARAPRPSDAAGGGSNQVERVGVARRRARPASSPVSVRSARAISGGS